MDSVAAVAALAVVALVVLAVLGVIVAALGVEDPPGLAESPAEDHLTI
jgi:hypothetical protein